MLTTYRKRPQPTLWPLLALCVLLLASCATGNVIGRQAGTREATAALAEAVSARQAESDALEAAQMLGTERDVLASEVASLTAAFRAVEEDNRSLVQSLTVASHASTSGGGVE